MSQAYTKSIRLNGEAGALFDHARSYLQTRGFTVISEERPFTIVAERGTRWPTSQVKKSAHTVNVAVHPANEGVTMSFIYLMSDFWNYTPGDRLYFDNEIEMFTRDLAVDGFKQEKQMAPSDTHDIAYIGELRELAKLKAEGLVTADEFEQKKKKLLAI
jgi:hypothetical protein